MWQRNSTMMWWSRRSRCPGCGPARRRGQLDDGKLGMWRDPATDRRVAVWVPLWSSPNGRPTRQEALRSFWSPGAHCQFQKGTRT
ncbi:hypothetical protein RHA1_ro00495 [Rhodococcus jostii RHA1]|uniref:Uncharacterized protein n=1 Tax=Rhodococcus jostii (strain RHA1) TaxID=101510 RepID=Q0SJF5_RHOJR|nr:hypothetical protein RHA1_ro00495 [Rhodococcus jostii RHA1]